MRARIFLLTGSMAILFLIGELFCRVSVGHRLIMQFENNGLHYFQPNQDGWYLLNYPPARINNVGARGKDVAVVQTLQKRKFIFLGDSFTFGWLLADTETIPHVFMEAMNLTDEEVLNYGNGGFGIDHMKEIYLYHQNLFSPQDTIIVILPELDFNRSLEPYNKNRWKEIFWWVRSKSSFISWSYAVLHHGYHRLLFFKKPASPPIIKAPLSLAFLERHLSELIDLIEKNQQAIVLVFYEFEKSRYSDMGEAFCKKHQLTCLTDVWRYVEFVKKEGKLLYALDQAHPSFALNQVVGRGIAQLMKQNLK